MKNIITVKRNQYRFIIQSLVLVFTTFLFLGIGQSQTTTNSKQKSSESKQTEPAKLNEQLKQDNSTISKDAVKVFVKQIQIYGKVAKPQAIFFYKSGDPKVDGLKINRHFFDHIFRDVEKSSIKRVSKQQAVKKGHIEW